MIVRSLTTDGGVTVALDRNEVGTLTVLIDHPDLPASTRPTVAGHLSHEGQGFRPVSHLPALQADTLHGIAALMEDR